MNDCSALTTLTQREWKASTAVMLPTLLASLAFSTTMLRAEVTEFRVTTQPSRADVSMDGFVVGTAPLRLTFPTPDTGQVTIGASLEGYETAQVTVRRAEVLQGKRSVHIELSLTRSEIVVTTTQDTPPAYDGLITLREAMAYARGDRELIGADRVASGLNFVGANHRERIVFSEHIRRSEKPTHLFLNGPLPAFDDYGDELIGPENRIVLMPATETAFSEAGLVCANTRVANVSLDGFVAGVGAKGFGEVRLENLSVESGHVGIRATDGCQVSLENVATAVEVAPILAAAGTIVDGVFEQIELGPHRTVTTHLDSPGPNAHLWFSGWFSHAMTPHLYVRQQERKPLHQVAGIVADSTSYQAYRIFSEEAHQQFALYAIDGARESNNNFLWEFRGPASQESLSIQVPRPLRTERIRVYHLPSAEHRLLKYELRLLDQFGAILFKHQVDADEDVDEIAVDPELDFFGIRLVIIEAKGNKPGIREIEADVLDSDDYLPLGYTKRRIVFPRPTGGSRAAVSFSGKLHLLGDKVFQDGYQFEQVDAISPSWMTPRTLLCVNSDDDVVTPDSKLTLREAILFINGTGDLSPDEQGQIVGDIAAPVAIEVLVGQISLRSALPAIKHPNVALRGNGLTLIGHDPHTPALSFLKGHTASLSNCDISGGIVSVERSIELRDSSIHDFAGVGVESDDGELYLARCRVHGGSTGIKAGGGLQVVESRFAQLKTGIHLTYRCENVVLGNTFEEVPVPLNVDEYSYTESWMIVAANTAPSDAKSQFTKTAAAGENPGTPYAALFVNNTPEKLGLPGDRFSLDRDAIWRGRMYDLRTGQGPPVLQHVDLNHSEARWLIERPGQRPLWSTSHATVLFDQPIQLWRVTPWGSQRCSLVPLTWPGSRSLREPGDFVIETRLGITSFAESESPRSGSSVAGAAPTARTKQLSAGSLIPGPHPNRAIALTGRVIDQSVESGNFAGAMDVILEAFRRHPENASLPPLFRYLAGQWLVSLEKQKRFEDAEVLLSEMGMELPDQSDAIEDLLNEHLKRQAQDAIADKSWNKARDALIRLLDREVTDDWTTNQTAYVYQEWAKTRMAQEPIDKVLKWLDESAQKHTAVRDRITKTANILVANEALAELKSAQPKKAFDLQSIAFTRLPDEGNRKNLDYVFQEWIRHEFKKGTTKTALTALKTAKSQHPTNERFSAIMAHVVFEKVEEEISHGNLLGAITVAGAVVRADGSDENQKVLVHAIRKSADVSKEDKGVEAATNVWSAAIKSFPDVTILKSEAAIFANNEGVELLKAKNYSDAVELFRRGATWAGPGDKQLNSNLRIAYSNWVVSEYNAKSFAEAVRIADEGLKQFPKDEKLTQLRKSAQEQSR